MSLRLRLIVLTGLLTGGTVLLFAMVFYLVLQDDLLDEAIVQPEGGKAL